ncbi:MAG: biotin--[acetyl-CoA-carboxylase] ligase [Clostridia bacterium]|nr:biotin--[acetyl-CoA-carboxylase] ligase [Clostridia bacterium]
MKIIELEEVNSTNEYCKINDNGEDLCVFAKRQTAGKGTKGRSFISLEGGLFVSVMRHYKNFSAESAFKIMVNGCVTVCRTLENFGLSPVIRWANDVLVCGKKICGTLIENTFSRGLITRSIVGIGINVNNEISPEIEKIAISMQQTAGKPFDLSEVKKSFLNSLKKDYTIEDYKKYINWFGQSVTLKTEEEERVVTALDITENGRLLVDWCGNMLEISAAEVSLRL